MQKIDINKKYKTRCGHPVRILCVDRKDSCYPVVALINLVDGDSVFCYQIDGKYIGVQEEESAYDLVEVSPYEDFKKDDKVMVSLDGVCWFKRYFSHVENEKPCTFSGGGTSWSYAEWTAPWNFCRKPTKEELGE